MLNTCILKDMSASLFSIFLPLTHLILFSSIRIIHLACGLIIKKNLYARNEPLTLANFKSNSKFKDGNKGNETRNKYMQELIGLFKGFSSYFRHIRAKRGFSHSTMHLIRIFSPRIIYFYFIPSLPSLLPKYKETRSFFFFFSCTFFLYFLGFPVLTKFMVSNMNLCKAESYVNLTSFTMCR